MTHALQPLGFKNSILPSRRRAAWVPTLVSGTEREPEPGRIDVEPPLRDGEFDRHHVNAMRLSVIVPVYNGAEFLRASLPALAASTHPDFEIVVVDDGSTDDSAAVARQSGATVLAMEKRGGPARARNHAARAVTGDVLVFIDADVRVHADTLARIDAHLSTHPEASAVMGSYDDTPTDPGFVSQYKNLFHHFIHQRSRRHAWTFWAGCGAIRRAVFLDAGGFSSRFDRPCIEDIELGARLADAGLRIDLQPDIQATHLKRWTFASLVRTDVWDRAVPWLTLMLRTGHMPPDLNVTHAHRASVVLAVLTAALLPILAAAVLAGSEVGSTIAAVTMAVATVLLLVLNLDLYRFFARKRGVTFALRAIPLHWFYYLYCAAGVAIALAIEARRRIGVGGRNAGELR